MFVISKLFSSSSSYFFSINSLWCCCLRICAFVYMYESFIFLSISVGSALLVVWLVLASDRSGGSEWVSFCFTSLKCRCWKLCAIHVVLRKPLLKNTTHKQEIQRNKNAIKTEVGYSRFRVTLELEDRKKNTVWIVLDWI